MAVSIETEPPFHSGTPIPLFRDDYINDEAINWDIRPTDKRFFMMKPAEIADEKSTAETPNKIIIVTNWSEERKERVPVQ